jgi:hypothetical protein
MDLRQFPEAWQLLIVAVVILVLSILNRSALFGKRQELAAPSSLPLAWLPAGHRDNPFPYDVLDCRPVALHVMATTGNPAIAATFAATRHLSARDLEAPALADPVAIDCDLTVPCGQALADGPIFMAPAMEHKWDVYAHGGRVVARRSWTADIVYLADTRWLPSGALRIDRLLTARAFSVSPGYDLADFEFLLRTYVSRIPAAFPIHPNVPGDDMQKIALAGWSAHGRIALFARAVDGGAASSK